MERCVTYRNENAIIMAAGLSSRFVPLSYEKPKALLEVKGEILIERQIKQLQAAGIKEIVIVVGYKKELFYYLKEKYGIIIVENNDYKTRNNNGSLYAARDYLKNTYICSADNFFSWNVFDEIPKHSYYSAVYNEGDTDEWCMTLGKDERINSVTIGGKDSWIMLGHAFFSKDFSEKFKELLINEYNLPETKGMLWEGIYAKHMDTLDMYVQKYKKEDIFEFDTLDELREFDNSYKTNAKSRILSKISESLRCNEIDISEMIPIKEKNEVIGFSFKLINTPYQYIYKTESIKKLV